jgi:hypothetical protein
MYNMGHGGPKLGPPMGPFFFPHHCYAYDSRMPAKTEVPALPHITFEYPEDEGGYKQLRMEKGPDDHIDIESIPTSKHSSMDLVMEELEKSGISTFKAILEKEGISSSVLPGLTDQHLKEIGIKKLGDRQKSYNVRWANWSPYREELCRFS